MRNYEFGLVSVPQVSLRSARSSQRQYGNVKKCYIGTRDVPKEKKMNKVKHRTTFSDLLLTRSGLSSNRQYVFVTRKDGTGKPLKTHIRRVPETIIIVERHILFAERARAISDLWNRISDGFKADLRIYTRVLNRQHRRKMHPVSAFNLSMKVLFGIHPPIFSLISVSDRIGSNLNEWIENGYLLRVKGDVSFGHDVRG